MKRWDRIFQHFFFSYSIHRFLRVRLTQTFSPSLMLFEFELIHKWLKYRFATQNSVACHFSSWEDQFLLLFFPLKEINKRSSWTRTQKSVVSERNFQPAYFSVESIGLLARRSDVWSGLFCFYFVLCCKHELERYILMLFLSRWFTSVLSYFSCLRIVLLYNIKIRYESN